MFCSSAVMFTLVVLFMLQPAAILSHLTYDRVIVTRFTLSMHGTMPRLPISSGARCMNCKFGRLCLQHIYCFTLATSFVSLGAGSATTRATLSSNVEWGSSWAA